MNSQSKGSGTGATSGTGPVDHTSRLQTTGAGELEALQTRRVGLNSQTGPRMNQRGWLRNGNRPGDPHAAPRCGAKTRRGAACQAPAMRNGRCRLHGGKSTGPRTAEGRERCRTANWKHGLYSKQARAERDRVRELLRSSAQLLSELR
jgi:hypothetical protein